MCKMRGKGIFDKFMTCSATEQDRVTCDRERESKSGRERARAKERERARAKRGKEKAPKADFLLLKRLVASEIDLIVGALFAALAIHMPITWSSTFDLCILAAHCQGTAQARSSTRAPGLELLLSLFFDDKPLGHIDVLGFYILYLCVCPRPSVDILI